MQDQRLVVQLSSSKELPFVNNKKHSKNYESKSKKDTKVRLHNLNDQVYENARSEKMKEEYVKLCNQVRFIYGVSVNKSIKHSFNSSLIKQNITQIQIPSDNRGSRNAKSKRKEVLEITSNRNNIIFVDGQHLAESQNSSFNQNITYMVQQSARVYFPQQEFSPILNTVIKVGRRKKILNNYLVKRLETQYLNIQKMKIEKKIRDDRKAYAGDIRSDSMINFGKRTSKTEQSEDILIGNSKFYRIKKQEDMLPAVVGVCKAILKESSHQQSSKKNLNSQIKSTNHSSSPVNRNIKTRSLMSSNYNKKSVWQSKKLKPFVPPFQTYYYRDLLWKVNFSNSMIVETPLQYEHRLRVFIGRGNNGGLLRGLIKRRIWFAVTERIQQANFVWTQIKYLPYFNLQKNRQNGSETKEQKLQTEQKKTKDKINQKGLLTQKQMQTFNSYFNRNSNIEERTDERFQYRNKIFSNMGNKNLKLKTLVEDNEKNEKDEDKDTLGEAKKQNQQEEAQLVQKNTRFITTILKTVPEIKQQKMQNHLINNYVIGNKKALLKTMNIYYKKTNDYVFNYLPYTFHIEKGLEDENYFKFLRFYYQRNKESKANGGQEFCTWIVKPGQYSNRGHGIKVCKNIDQIKSIVKVKEKLFDGSQRTYIVQAYIEKPLLYNKRKFDLRHYMMITCVNGVLKGYWYRQGYVRTSSSQYTLSTNDCRIHLTNDAVQKTMPEYGKFQKGNKISYDQLHNYLQKFYGFKNYNFKEIMIPKMKKITTDIIYACSGSIDPKLHSNNFQIFGLDFMIDADFNLWLIEVNTNPCLQLSCPLLANLIPKMIENALELTMDATYPPPIRFTPKGVHYLKKLEQQNKFDLVYDSRIDGFFKQSECAIDARLLNQQQETYEDEGQQWNQDN